jgi:predicted Zn-dependent protease
MGAGNVGVINSTSINAYAYTEDNRIAITDGFLMLLENDSQLAIVLGHELSHLNGVLDEEEADYEGTKLAGLAEYNLDENKRLLQLLKNKGVRK